MKSQTVSLNLLLLQYMCAEEDSPQSAQIITDIFNILAEKTIPSLIYAKLRKYPRITNEEYEELFQIAYLTTHKAVKTFDYSYGEQCGAKFTTYWATLANHDFNNYLLSRQTPYRVSDKDSLDYFKFYNFMTDFHRKHDDDPSIDEIAMALHCSIARVHEIMNFPFNLKFKHFGDKSEMINDGFDIQDHSIDSEEIVCQKIANKKMIDTIFSKLAKNEALFLSLVFGLDNRNQSYSTKEIADIFNIPSNKFNAYKSDILKKCYLIMKQDFPDFSIESA